MLTPPNTMGHGVGHGDRHLTRLCTIKDMMFCYYGLWGWGLLAQSWVKCLSPRPSPRPSAKFDDSFCVYANGRLRRRKRLFGLTQTVARTVLRPCKHGTRTPSERSKNPVRTEQKARQQETKTPSKRCRNSFVRVCEAIICHFFKRNLSNYSIVICRTICLIINVLDNKTAYFCVAQLRHGCGTVFSKPCHT